jgi:flagellar hook-associated protein 2
MTMRVTGLASGLDTESIISALVSSYELKTQKYTKAQTKLSWTQDAWKSLNTKVYSLYTNVSNLRFSSAYTTKKATVSDATKVSVTASGSAVNGTQKLKINSVAQSGYMTGARINTVKETNREETDTKLSELGYTGDATSFDIVKGDGTTTKVSVNRGSTISDVLTAFQNAGLNANFDTNQGRFYISSKSSGKDADFTIVSKTATTKNADGTETVNNDSANALYALGLATESNGATGTASSNVKFSFSGTYGDGTTVTNTINVSFDGPASAEDAEEQNALVEALKTGKVNVSSPDNMALNYTIGENGEYYLDADGYIYKTGDTEKKAIAKWSQNLDGLKSDPNNNGELLDFDTITWGTATVTGGSTASYNLAKKLDGEDAEIELSGVTYTNSTNSFSINGLSINALAKTGDGEEITITTTTDTQAIYDKIKDFLTEYNTVINEMTELYNADSSYGYEPLTDDEKDAMSDTEIEKWETKIKDSLLRNDSTLNGVMMAMINSMSSSYTVNGQKYTLSTFGIATLGYLNAAENENYAYHIDGDSDDDNTSSNEDKLMTAITEDPDTVIDFMKQLSSGLYTALGNKMKSTTLSSAYTIYNDKEMNSQYSEYSKTISSWEDKLADKEDYYYEKFSKMESALTTLQSQSSSITGLFSS